MRSSKVHMFNTTMYRLIGPIPLGFVFWSILFSNAPSPRGVSRVLHCMLSSRPRSAGSACPLRSPARPAAQAPASGASQICSCALAPAHKPEMPLAKRYSLLPKLAATSPRTPSHPAQRSHLHQARHPLLQVVGAALHHRRRLQQQHGRKHISVGAQLLAQHRLRGDGCGGGVGGELAGR